MFQDSRPLDPAPQSSELNPALRSAVFWRAAIRKLACEFSGNSCEMTHSEAEYRDDRADSVALCLSLGEAKFADFADYLTSYLPALGSEHSHVRVYVGFNYGNPGLISVENGRVTFDKSKDILDLPDMPRIGYGSCPDERQAVQRFEEDVCSRIAQVVAKERHMSGEPKGDSRHDSRFDTTKGGQENREPIGSSLGSLGASFRAPKITTAICKTAIAQYCRENPEEVSRQFVSPLTEDEQGQAAAERNWARIAKRNTADGVEREFDCRPFDDQLRAIVLTDTTDTSIISVVVQGE